MTESSLLLTPLEVKGLSFKNRVIMAPMYLGYANPDGTVSPLTLDHYHEMGGSGVSAVVVENAAVQPSGMGLPFHLKGGS